MTAQKLGRRTMDLVALAATIAFTWFMWPSSLGGSSRLVLVHGHSMEPTYLPGELVFLDTSVEPHVGDVIVFEIPEGELAAGQVVVHRIVGQRADGTFETQGDNSNNPDGYRVTRGDILGSPRFSLPGGGRVLAWLSSPIGIGGVAGLMSTALLWPRRRWPRLVTPESVGLAIDDEGWSSLRLTDQVKRDADAWLESELADMAK